MVNEFESKLILCDNEEQFYKVVEVVKGLGYRPYASKSSEWEDCGYNVRLWEDGDFTRQVWWDVSNTLKSVAAKDFLAQHKQPTQCEATHQHNIKTLFQAPSGQTFDTMEQAVLHDKLWHFLTNELDIADTNDFDVAFEKAVKAIREDISERKEK